MRQEEQQVKDENKEEKEQGRYIYCVVERGNILNPEFQEKGIENNPVYTICQGNLCAMVHDCPATPYISNDKEQVIVWVKAHQKIIDAAYAQLGNVIPFTFDVIIKGKNPEQSVREWLRRDEEELKKKIERTKGKQEFGIKIFLHKEHITKIIDMNNKEIQEIKENIKTAKKGMAYFHKQKIQKIVEKESEKYAALYSKEVYNQIISLVYDIKVQKTQKHDDTIMIMHASVLVKKEDVQTLGTILDHIHKKQGFSVEFTGPWPPYSFTS